MAAQNPPGSENGPLAEAFVTTHWSVVNRAGDVSSPESRRALEHLCTAYYSPLYAYVRRRGHRVEDAQDFTQQFFAHLLEHNSFQRADRNRGRFRSFLLTSLKNFLINEWKRNNREKNGGGQKLLSLDEEMAEARFAAAPTTAQPPDALYDRGWAAVLLERALAALRAEFEQAGKVAVFKRLKDCVLGEQSPYVEIARELGLTEGAARVAVHRLRQRFNELLRSEVAQTVSTPAEVNEELRYLVTVLRDTQGGGIQ